MEEKPQMKIPTRNSGRFGATAVADPMNTHTNRRTNMVFLLPNLELEMLAITNLEKKRYSPITYQTTDENTRHYAQKCYLLLKLPQIISLKENFGNKYKDLIFTSQTRSKSMMMVFSQKVVSYSHEEQEIYSSSPTNSMCCVKSISPFCEIEI